MQTLGHVMAVGLFAAAVTTLVPGGAVMTTLLHRRTRQQLSQVVSERAAAILALSQTAVLAGALGVSAALVTELLLR